MEERIREQLMQLAYDLAYSKVLHEFRRENIGIDQSFSLKYYIGLEFRIDPSLSSTDLFRVYQKTIYSLFCDNIKPRSSSPENARLHQEHF